MSGTVSSLGERMRPVSDEILDLCGELRKGREVIWAGLVASSYCGGIVRDANRNVLAVLKRLDEESQAPLRVSLTRRVRRTISILEAAIHDAEFLSMQKVPA